MYTNTYIIQNTKYKYKYLQGDASRPNSIYNLSGPPTDLEASRPQSALTSYSNFHPAQRRVVPTSSNSGPPRGGPLPQGVTSLTQESLMNVSLILIRILFNTLYFFPLDGVVFPNPVSSLPKHMLMNVRWVAICILITGLGSLTRPHCVPPSPLILCSCPPLMPSRAFSASSDGRRFSSRRLVLQLSARVSCRFLFHHHRFGIRFCQQAVRQQDSSLRGRN